MLYEKKTKNVQNFYDWLYIANNLQNLCDLFSYVIGFQKSLKLLKSDRWKGVETKIKFVTEKSSHSGSKLWRLG